MVNHGASPDGSSGDHVAAASQVVDATVEAESVVCSPSVFRRKPQSIASLRVPKSRRNSGSESSKASRESEKDRRRIVEPSSVS